VVTSLLSFRRFLGVTTALSMALPALPAASFAQDANDGSAPPARVGQITSISGDVSFNGSGTGGWAAAADNYPVTSGDSIYTQDGSRAAIALDSSQITLSSDTEIQVTGLDNQNFTATLAQGEAAFAINYLQPGQVFTLSTPRGTVTINQNGQYDIITGDANNPTIVNVFSGAATVSDPGANLQVAAGQAAYLSGTDQTTAQLGQAQQDSFTSTALAQAAPPPPSYAPAVTNQMTGVAELSQYGSWQQSPQYGAVWYPSVDSGWAPYREGHWADIQPWGWTWVESEPWGFAPFHYGRWIDYGGRWGWAPAPAYDAGSYGPSYQPVYAPAVVSFFGLAVAAGITAAVLSSGSVGWVPLAPGEPYYPTYRAPPAYIRQINVVNVRNINDVHVTNNYYYGNNFSPNQLANRRAATFVSADVMSHGEHVSGYAHTPSQNELAGARPVDTGFGGHPAAQGAAFRLPESGRPLAALRPGNPPHPTAFADRHTLPPATVSHAPFAGHPGTAAPGAPHEMGGAVPAVSHPGFATTPGGATPGGAAPGFHPPPAPPAPGQHLGTLPPAGNFHPASENHGAPSFSHPAETAPFHPQTEPHTEQHPGPAPDQGFHPASQAYHPPAESYHPPAPEHAPANNFHPATQAYHPPAPAYHPQEQFHPQATAPRPMPAPHPEQHAEPGHGGGDKKHN